MKTKKVPGWLSFALAGGTLAALLWWERRRPLRRQVEAKLPHEARNLVVAALSAATVQWVEQPFVAPLAALVEKRRWGVVKRLGLPRWLEVTLTVLLLDYTFYLWHVLTHRISFLWRFHQPHHVDWDLTASTALRFHFGEIALSVPWRAGQVLLIGVSPLALSVWQTAMLVEILFQHSNVELPWAIERWLCRLVVTPRLHGIHHSIVQEEQDSNWSSGLTIWDWLHGTFRLNLPQEAITIGVPAYRKPRDNALLPVLKMPFEAQRPPWQLADGASSDKRTGLTYISPI